MNYIENTKKFCSEEKNKLFFDAQLDLEAFKFSLEYSMLIENCIIKILNKMKLELTVASVGSFSRRELSPFSDIDIMIISSKGEDHELIKKAITALWDAGIEVSHTVRTFADIKKFINEDLHSFTQFFETRFLYGKREFYDKWIKNVFSSIENNKKAELIFEFFNDVRKRHQKYGDSPKVLEPNIKFTAGGLRDLHVVEWMYSLKNNILFTEQSEITQTEHFVNILLENEVSDKRELLEVQKSYELVLSVRNILHLTSKHKTDRLEFTKQEQIAEIIGYKGSWRSFMKRYFKATSLLNRFSVTMMKQFEEQITNPISDYLAIELDEDFYLKGNIISIKNNHPLSLSEIMRTFYYCAINNATPDQNLRSLIIQSVELLDESHRAGPKSSVFFREILKVKGRVSKTLFAMNELGVLGAFLPEFKELVGFFQPGVYHCYTADEHTLVALRNLEELEEKDIHLEKIYSSMKNKDLLNLAVLFHDIAKPISISGHEIIGAEIASSIMEHLGYENEEIDLVTFLVKNHLIMEQIAFRRNIDDPITLDNFASIFSSINQLNALYLLTYADLSAVNNTVWTQWKNDQLYELYRKIKLMLEDTLTGKQLLFSPVAKNINRKIKKNDNAYKEHVDAIDDISYFKHFNDEEILQHINEIKRGTGISVFFKEEEHFTNITIITKDYSSLLAKVCGALAINDINIHNAHIFTRKDGIAIDSFNVTDFRTHQLIEKKLYDKIKNDIYSAVKNELRISKEFNNLKSRWWRLENKFFKRKSKISIRFEEHEKHTIIDVVSPDRLGLLYQITRTLTNLGITISFAVIGTKGDDVIDSFYTLSRTGDKIFPHDYEMIRLELTNTINEMI